jgi:signal transduction histidine kinase
LADLGSRGSRPPPRHPAMRALHERRTVRFPVDDETLDQMSADKEYRHLIGQIPMKHGVSVPMVGRTRLLGTITFLTFRETPFSDSDVAFAEELVRRVTLSIDNALLHERTLRAVQDRSDLLAIVSHDLRNPLATIRMAADVLRRSGAADESKCCELADRITRKTDEMIRLIGDLLDASKMESGTFSVEQKAELIEPLIEDALETFRDAAATKSIVLRAEVEGTLSAIHCDRRRVLQVLSNLIANALKFTPGDGAITVSAQRAGEDARISVCDTGPGIPDEQRRRVFDRYWQGRHQKRAGAGLGLFIVKGIVEAHGGRVWVEAAPGGGACICFTLRVAPTMLEHLSDAAQH